MKVKGGCEFSEETDLCFAYEEYLLKLESRGYAPETIRLKRWILRDFSLHAKKKGITDVRHVTGEFLRGYMHHVSVSPTVQGKERYATCVIGTIATHLRVFFRHLSKRGMLLFDPGRSLERVRDERTPPVPLSPLEAERVISLPDLECASGLRDRAILELFYGTGIRRAELSFLRMEDVRMDSGTVFVRHGKGRRERVIPAGERALSWIRRYLEGARPALRARAKGDDDAAILFLGRLGGRLSESTLTGIGSKYLRRAGIASGSCHIFRHTCATEMLSNGADIVHIQELLGHANAGTSQIYTHVSPERLREKYMRAHPSVFSEVKPSEPGIPAGIRVAGSGRCALPGNSGRKKREFPVRNGIERSIHDHIVFRSSELAERSRESFLSYLYNFSEWCSSVGVKSVPGITRDILERYQGHLSKRKKKAGGIISLKTQRYEMESVCSFVRWCHVQGLILCDPSSGVELPRVGKSLVSEYLTSEEVVRILSLPDTDNRHGLRDRAALEILYATGIRAGEFCSLSVSDADFERDSIRVHASKLGRSRVIPVSPRAMKWLYRYVHEVRDEFAAFGTEILFLQDTGMPFQRHALNRLCRSYLTACGIKRGSIHIFRHTCATHMIENGADLRTIQEFLGHRCIESTRVYAHISILGLKKVHAQTHPAERRFLERMRMADENGDAPDASVVTS